MSALRLLTAREGAFTCPCGVQVIYTRRAPVAGCALGLCRSCDYEAIMAGKRTHDPDADVRSMDPLLTGLIDAPEYTPCDYDDLWGDR